jgi:hypothetical protein
MFLFHQSAGIRRSFAGFVGQLLLKDIPESKLRSLFDVVYGELPSVVKKTEDLNEQLEDYQIDKVKYRNELAIASYLAVLRLVVLRGGFQSELINSAADLVKCFRRFGGFSDDSANLELFSFLVQVIGSQFCNEFFQKASYRDFLRGLDHLSYHHTKIPIFTEVLDFVPEANLIVFVKSEFFENLLLRVFGESSSTDEFRPVLRGFILNRLANSASLGKLLGVLWDRYAFMKSLRNCCFDYFRLMWQILKRFPESADVIAGDALQLEFSHAIVEFMNKRASPRIYELKVFSRALSQFNFAYSSRHRNDSRFFKGNLVEWMMSKYESCGLTLRPFLDFLGADAKLPAGETGLLRLIVSLCDMQPKFAAIVFEQFDKSVKAVASEVPSKCVKYIPTYLAHICRLRWADCGQKAEIGMRINEIMLRELTLIAQRKTTQRVVGPILRFLPCVLRLSPELFPRFVQLFNSLATDSQFFCLENLELLSIIAQKQDAERWIDTMLEFIARAIVNGEETAAIVVMVGVAGDFWCRFVEEFRIELRPIKLPPGKLDEFVTLAEAIDDKTAASQAVQLLRIWALNTSTLL